MRFCATPSLLLCAAAAIAQEYQRPGWEAECKALESDATLRGTLRPDMFHSQYEYVAIAQRLGGRIEFVLGEIERCYEELQAAEQDELKRHGKEELKDAIRLSEHLATAMECCLSRTMSRAAEELLSVDEVSVVRWNSRAPFDVEMQRLEEVVEWRVTHASTFGQEDLRIFYRVCGGASAAIRVPVLRTPGSTVEVGFGWLLEHFAWDRWFRVDRESRRDWTDD